MAVHYQAVDATVDLSVRVPRNGDGTLADAAEGTLARIDAIEAVDDVCITGVEPRSNAVYADVEASLRIAVPGDRPAVDEAVGEQIGEVVGVSVDTVRIET